MSKITINISNFEGPLDLLLELIEVNQMDICDIAIAEITDQYLAYLKEMEEIDLAVASDFLVMATVLLDLKLKTLFPKHSYNKEWSKDLTEDPRQSLIERLLEYKLFKDTAALLKEQELQEEKSYSKKKVDAEYEKLKTGNTVMNFDLTYLYHLYEDLMKDYEENEKTLKDYHVTRPKISFRHAKELILTNLQMNDGVMDFMKLLRHRPKMELIVLFLSLLDLYKLSLVELKQDETFGSLWVEQI